MSGKKAAASRGKVASSPAKRPPGTAARRFYEEIREFVPVGLFILSPAGIIQEANRRGARALGSTPEKLSGRSFFDLIYPLKDREACRKILARSLNARTREKIEITLGPPGGGQTTVALEFAASGTGRQRVVLVSLDDITDRVASERHSSRLLTAVEQASDAIAVVQPEGVIYYVNRSFEGTYGTSREAVKGRSYFELLAAAAADARWSREARDAMARGIPWKGRVRRQGRESRPLVLEIEIAPIRDPARNIFSFLIIERDMTRESELEEHLRRVQKSDAVGAIAGGIAHDLNNVLGPIIINTELAQGDVGPDSALKPLLDGILKSAYRARDLVRQVMAFSSPRAALLSPVRLSDVIRDASSLLRASVPSTIKVEDRTPGVQGVVEADPTQIYQVLVNLVNNAVQAMRDGGGTLTLDLERIDLERREGPGSLGLKAGPYLRLSIADTGGGIAPDIVGKIFDPFFTTKSPGTGMGLGLAVVKRIMAGHGGTVTATSEPGGGSVFRVYLPEIREEAGPAIEAEAQPPAGCGRVLLVDDEEILLRSVGAALERLGYTVTATSDPGAALELLRGDPGAYDLLLTDLTMPGMSGLALATDASRIRPDLPIVLCTGIHETLDPEVARLSGIRISLKKPLGLREIAKALRGLLGETAGAAS